MSDFVKYVVKLLGKGCPLWASVEDGSEEGSEDGLDSEYQNQSPTTAFSGLQSNR